MSNQEAQRIGQRLFFGALHRAQQFHVDRGLKKRKP
jgi:hypothetical protein